ncbi:hypothetical protein [Cystobacter ferrugineus]|uniref:Uncharacterized protein n=1 Tax=Cystobacter ferrugineus TaxID=83449 RepID=A0A1L9AVE5_9BACT|nr:hypothetical protein [Cystobacter ferrugineus]OJH33893.1 hypothetical protein BON30_46035 [Cystobacter ferrugineus]
MVSVTKSVSRAALAELQRLIEANPSVDWRAIALDSPAELNALEWHELEPEAVVPLLKAYQRLVRILPESEERRALPLLESGLHSSIQIANLSRDEFARRWNELFPGNESLGLAVHRAAISRRSELLLHHINDIQRNEPHYRAARFR